jgi:hypothetical protein
LQLELPRGLHQKPHPKTLCTESFDRLIAHCPTKYVTAILLFCRGTTLTRLPKRGAGLKLETVTVEAIEATSKQPSFKQA